MYLFLGKDALLHYEIPASNFTSMIFRGPLRQLSRLCTASLSVIKNSNFNSAQKYHRNRSVGFSNLGLGFLAGGTGQSTMLRFLNGMEALVAAGYPTDKDVPPSSK